MGTTEASGTAQATPDASDTAATIEQPISDEEDANTVEADEAGTGVPALPLTEDGEQIVARVNGEAITLSRFQRALDRNPNAFDDVASYDALVEQELTKLIEQTVINQFAAEIGLTVTEADVSAEYQTMREIVPDDAAWQQWLMSNRFINEEEFLQSSYEALLTQRVQAHVLANETLTVPQVRARHILVESRQQAEAVRARLQSGEDFAAVAAEVSLDETTRNSGGDLGVDGGYIVPEDLIVPELVDVALNQQPGQFSEPVQTALGYHIIQTIEIGQRPATAEEIAARNSELFDNWLRERIAAATIERYIN
ncbi:MAG: peptidylprolyl isomerase [Chloroflexota bacterium]